MRVALTALLFLASCSPSQSDRRERLTADALLPSCANADVDMKILESGGLFGQDYLDELTIDVTNACRTTWLKQLQADPSFHCSNDRCESKRVGGKQTSVDLTASTVIIEIDQM